MSEKNATHCAKSSKFGTHRHRWVRWTLPITGLAALTWFLIRVVPKPPRAAYPCQQTAVRLASGFVIWLVGLVSSVTPFKRARQLLKNSQLLWASVCLAIAAVMGLVPLTHPPDLFAQADQPPGWGIHAPVGQGKGIHPGRVVWVHDPDATDWEGYDSATYWWQDESTDQAVVEEMVSWAIRSVASQNSDAAAWDAIFRHFNAEQGRVEAGYRAGEKIAIKINLTTCNAAGEQVDPVTYDKRSNIMNRIDNSPQMALALLRQLVDTVGVDADDITIGDPTGLFPNYAWNMLKPEFPDVHYLDNYGGSGRTRAEFSNVPVYWSTAEAENKVPDYVPVSFAQADYVINFAILKGHSSGITLTAKNHFGSLIRTPSQYLRPDLPGRPGGGSRHDYYDLHLSLPNAGRNPPWNPGTGKYRALVDLMGHSDLGGKTLLYLIDGLYGGYYWEAHPYKWQSPPFNGDWPSSILASQDPVAIDSVGYDFVNAEWPDVVRYGRSPAPQYDMEGGAEDYLHEAAQADAPPSGTFYDPSHPGDVTRLQSLGVHEHWNNPIDKQYSRNLGADEGIELIRLPSELYPGDADQDLGFDQLDLVQVQVAAKYLTGEPATWGEGDWNGAPGGSPGDPPLGDGVFNQLDIVSALKPAHYLTGSYVALAGTTSVDVGMTDEQTSLLYNPGTGELQVNAPASTNLTSVSVHSAAAIFTGEPAMNLGGSFDNDSDHNVFKATFGSSFGSLTFGNVAQRGLSADFIVGDLTVVGSLEGGGDLGPVDLLVIPEPPAITLWAVALVCLLTLRRRWPAKCLLAH